MPIARAIDRDIVRTDDEISSAAEQALSVRKGLPATIRVAIRDGCVTLTGDVPWPFHRVAAELAVHDIPGVKGVTNLITVTPLASYVDVRHRIGEALHGVTAAHARYISIAIRGSTVTLAGHVASQAQREAVETAAAAAPGITSVANLIEIREAA